jgi:hypothetical protein
MSIGKLLTMMDHDEKMGSILRPTVLLTTGLLQSMLTTGTIYLFRVAAVNHIGCSLSSRLEISSLAERRFEHRKDLHSGWVESVLNMF